MANSFPARLTAAREAKGISRKSLAELLGTSESQVWRYEKGQNAPTSDLIVRLCEVFNVSSDFLLGLTDTQQVRDPTIKNIRLQVPPIVEFYDRNRTLTETEVQALNVFQQIPFKRQRELIEVMTALSTKTDEQIKSILNVLKML